MQLINEGLWNVLNIYEKHVQGGFVGIPANVPDSAAEYTNTQIHKHTFRIFIFFETDTRVGGGGGKYPLTFLHL